MTEHERGWDAGYSAAIHDARVEGSRAHAELDHTAEQAVGFLRVYCVVGKVAGVVHWKHDVVARDDNHACELAREFILTNDGLDHLRGENVHFSAERARALSEPWAWVIGLRDPEGDSNG